MASRWALTCFSVTLGRRHTHRDRYIPPFSFLRIITVIVLRSGIPTPDSTAFASGESGCAHQPAHSTFAFLFIVFSFVSLHPLHRLFFASTGTTPPHLSPSCRMSIPPISVSFDCVFLVMYIAVSRGSGFINVCTNLISVCLAIIFRSARHPFDERVGSTRRLLKA